MTPRQILVVLAAGCSFLALSADTVDAAPQYPWQTSETTEEPEDPEVATGMDFLRDYAETGGFRLGLPTSIEMTPSGDAIFFLRSGPRSRVRDLYIYDPVQRKERQLISASEMLAQGEEQLTLEEKARRERMRLSAAGVATFSLSGDGDHILAPLSGRLFVVSWREPNVTELSVAGGFPIDPRFSPDGNHVAYAADGDLWVVPVAGGPPRRLTEKDGEHVANGVPEFAAQEEMDRDHGYWWSPDSKFLAYQRNDDSELPLFYISDPSDPAKPPQSWRYPRAGTKNTDVRLAIVPVTGGEPVWVKWDRAAYPYLATVKWEVAGAPLTILVQDRAQQEEILFAVDPATGETRELLRETDDAWLNLDQQMPKWLKDGEAFLWTTERRGAWQLEVREADGKLRNVVTRPSLAYKRLVHVDEDAGHVYVEGQPSVLDTQAYRIGLDGSDQRAVTAGLGMRRLEISADGSLQVLEEETPDAAPRIWIRNAAGEPKGTLETTNEWPGFDLHVEYEQVGIDPAFYSAVIRPFDFDPTKKYPVILHVYGGPHNQMVARRATDKLLDQWLANQGFVVVLIDGRGTPYRGRDWERSIRGNFIERPLADQALVLQLLGARFEEMDLERVGVYGWSFGGYFSAMAVMQRPDLFRAGVAGAPVTDWRDYDTHYTERYIGLPDENPEAYQVSNVLTYADQLKRPLLIIHGTADDNVYFVHGLKMSDALTRAGVRHEFVPLSSQTHMVVQPDYVEIVRRLHVEFFEKHLGHPEG